MNWYIKKGDEQYGPYTSTELMAMYQKGDFTKKTPVWVYQKDGWDWIAAEEVIELNEIFSPSETTVPMGLTTSLFSLQPSAESLMSDKIWAVASGKGGVGKSLVSSSLAIGLTVLGKRVILVDLDLGGENLHTLFGVTRPSETLHDFLSGRVSSLSDLAQKTRVERLSLISGHSGALGGANILHAVKKKLLSHLRDLDCDYLILDVGAGTAYNQLDFFLEADHGIVVTMPEPHAIQDAFYFIKMALFRKIAWKFKNALVLSDYFKTGKHLKVERIETFLNEIQKLDLEKYRSIQNVISSFHPKIILNQIMHRSELKDGVFLKASLKDMLHIQADYLGYILFDAKVRRATQNLRPLLIDYPKSKAASCIFSIIVHKLLNRQYLRAVMEERGLQRKVRGLNYESTYKGYRSGIGIYS